MSNCKVALKDRTDALEGQTINRPELSQMLLHLQIQISAHYTPSVLLFHTSTAFRTFIFVNKNRNKCVFGSQLTHPQTEATDELHLLVSFGRSLNTIITTRWAPAEGRCCELFAARSIKLLCKKWHWDIVFHLFRIVFSVKGVVHLGWGPCSQSDSANKSEAHDNFTELSGHHSFPVEGETELYCTSRGGYLSTDDVMH